MKASTKIVLAACCGLLGFVGCAQILGIDDRQVTVSGDGGGDVSVAPEASSDGNGGDSSDAGDPLSDCGGDALVDLKTDPLNCSACGKVCSYDGGLQHVTAQCNSATCTSGCESLWADCTDSGMGCTYDVSGDIQNCGACAHVCGNANAKPTCDKGACNPHCNPGTAHCVGDDSNGCETSISGDAKNCGACGFDCGNSKCIAGVCQLTADMEKMSGEDGMSPIAMDTKSIYWVSSSTSPASVRVVNKDGTGLKSLYGGGMVDGMTPNSAIAVDKDYVYFRNNTYGIKPYRGNKLGGQTPISIMPPDPGANGTALTVDTDDSADATRLFFTQAVNGGGFYRYVLGGQNWEAIDGSGEARAMMRIGTEMYWAVGAAIKHADMSAMNPSVKTLTMLTGNVYGMSNDGTYLYASTNDGNVQKVTLANGSSQSLYLFKPVCGLRDLVSDGTDVWVRCDNDLWHGKTSVSTYTLVVDHASLGNTAVHGLLVDKNAVYFATYINVYKMHK